MRKQIRDFHFRNQYNFQKIDRCLWKTLIRNPYFSTFSLLPDFCLANYHLRGPWIHNYCFSTGKSRGIIFSTGLSRNQFKNFLNRGLVFSYRKHSW